MKMKLNTSFSFQQDFVLSRYILKDSACLRTFPWKFVTFLIEPTWYKLNPRNLIK